MRIRDRRAESEPEINLVPLIDVILVLIIFFVITTTFDLNSAFKLELPQASADQTEVPSQALSVLVNAEGRYFIGDHEALRTDVESLKRTIIEVVGDDRDRPVLLRADARTPHQAVVTAMDALGQVGFRRISIATAPDQAAGQ